MKLKAVLFDLDGVLVDAADWHYSALNAALMRSGFCPINREDHEARYNGLPTHTKLDMLHIPEEYWEAISAEKQFQTRLMIEEECKANIEKIELLWTLRKFYKIAVCSNSIRASIFLMLQKSQLLPYIDFIIGNDDGVKPKPSPDIYLKAFRALSVVPEECLILEDSPHGIQSARESGAKYLPVMYKDVTLNLFRNHRLL